MGKWEQEKTLYNPEDLLSIVSELAWKYSGNESTSITYETAQTLMEAVLYCMEEYARSGGASPARKNTTVREQYDTGLGLVTEKVQRIRSLFNGMAESFDDYGVRCLYDTVQKGIPQFLRRYQVRFCPQDTILTLDYPILEDRSSRNGSCSGADAIYRYLCAIRTEQHFLGRLDRNYIVSVLESYDPGYRDMMENICAIVLANVIGHIAIWKPLEETGFREEEYGQLAECFGGKTAEETEKAVRRFIQIIIERLYGNDAEMQEYLCRSARDLSVRIGAAGSGGRWDRVFLL